ncbi:MAG: hypothetical protein ACK5MN_03150 [Lachnospiraceae bacterium]
MDMKSKVKKWLNPHRIIILSAYIISAIYTLVMLPYGIVLSTDIYSTDAVTAPTWVYLLGVLIVEIILTSPKLRWGTSEEAQYGKDTVEGRKVTAAGRILRSILLFAAHIWIVMVNI